MGSQRHATARGARKAPTASTTPPTPRSALARAQEHLTRVEAAFTAQQAVVNDWRARIAEHRANPPWRYEPRRETLARQAERRPWNAQLKTERATLRSLRSARKTAREQVKAVRRALREADRLARAAARARTRTSARPRRRRAA